MPEKITQKRMEVWQIWVKIDHATQHRDTLGLFFWANELYTHPDMTHNQPVIEY